MLNGRLFNIKNVQCYIKNIGDVQAHSQTVNHITFGKEMSSVNYAVLTSIVGLPQYWASCGVTTSDYNTDGFNIYAFNNGESVCNNLYISWIAIEFAI